jgi:bifunctional lysine-specific demethylase and histidyl-hydroxylase NO66
MASADALTRCVGDPDHFAARVWGRQVHLHREEDGFADLLTLDEVDRLLSATALRVPAFRLVRDGRPLPASAFTMSAKVGGVASSGLADPRRIFALVDEGATVVLQGAHRYHPPLARLCRDLELELGHPCQVNAYVTPPGARGLGVHHDAHDVFVLQAFGSKHWQVHPTPAEKRTGNGSVRELVLEPGDALYLPTGTPHAGQAQRALSGHLTVGIHPRSWRDAVRKVVDRAFDDARLDEPLPAGYHRDLAGFAEELRERALDVARQWDKVDVDEVAAGVVDRFLTTRAPLLRGGLVDRARLADLDDDSVVRRRAGSACEVRPAGDRVRLLLGDRELRMPAWLQPTLHDLASSTGAMRVGDLTGLDAPSRLVLVRRLVREGLLEVVG